MKLVKLNCTNCNAPLEVEEDQKKVKCKYCHATIYIDDEIIKVNHTIYSGEKEERIKNADALLKLKEYDDALIQYKALSKEYAYEPKIWYSMVLCLTEEFTNLFLDTFDQPQVDIIACNEYMDKYEKIETDEDLKKKRVNEYNNFKKKLNNIIEEREKIKDEEYKKNGEVFEASIKIATIGIAIIIVLLIVISIISRIGAIIAEKNKDKEFKRANISVTSFFNNSKEAEYELQEVRNDGILCYHFTFHSDDILKQYTLSYLSIENGVSSTREDFSNKFEDKDTGWVCWNMDKDDYLDTGKYVVELFVEVNDKAYSIDKNSIEVVSSDE